MEDETKIIPGFKIKIDKTPPKWVGSVYLQSEYKEEAHYFTSTQDSFESAIDEACQRYRHRVIEGISLKKVSNDQP